LRVAKLLANFLFDLLQTFFNLFPHAFGKIFVVLEEGVAGFSGDNEARRHGQAGASHLAKSRAFASE
jgi:hypothetical protein